MERDGNKYNIFEVTVDYKEDIGKCSFIATNKNELHIDHPVV